MLHRYLRFDISQSEIHLHTQIFYFYSIRPNHISQNLNHLSYSLLIEKFKKFYFLYFYVPALSFQVPFSSFVCSIETTPLNSLSDFSLSPYKSPLLLEWSV